MNKIISIYCDYGIYSAHKVKMKNIMNVLGLKWISSKMNNFNNEILINQYTIFGCIDKISNDENLKGRSGSSGMWDSGENSIKIIMIDKKGEEEHLPILLVFKGNEDSIFYNEFIRYCMKLECSILCSVLQKEAYEKFNINLNKRINLDSVERLKNPQETKSVMKESFLLNINSSNHIGYVFSESFIKKWQSLIDKYGLYTDRMLYEEMERVNEKRRKEKEHRDYVNEYTIEKLKVYTIDEHPPEEIKIHKFTIKKLLH